MKLQRITLGLIASLSILFLIPQSANAWIGSIPSCDLDTWDIKSAIQGAPGLVPPTIDNNTQIIVYRATTNNPSTSGLASNDITIDIYQPATGVRFGSSGSDRRLEITNATATTNGIRRIRFTSDRQFITGANTNISTSAGTSNNSQLTCVQFNNNIPYFTTYMATPNPQVFKMYDFTQTWSQPSDDTDDDGGGTTIINNGSTDSIDMSAGQKIGLVIVFAGGLYLIWILRFRRNR